MSRVYRCAGEIQFDDAPPVPGQMCNVQLKQFSDTCSLLQLLTPLTPAHPYFSAQLRSLGPDSKIVLGIAGTDIDEEAYPGNWNNSVGYHSNTGLCYTAHRSSANTVGESFSIEKTAMLDSGDVFGLLVTHFGQDMSTVMFLKNGLPVGTRYLFEPDHSRFLPTLSLQNGPIELGVMWPESVQDIPKYNVKNMDHWMKPPEVKFDHVKNLFYYNGEVEEVCIQSPQPLNSVIRQYDVVIQDTSNTGAGPSIAIASCCPLKPTPTCQLLRDYFKWNPNGEKIKVSIGQKMGWGIHYSPDQRNMADFDDKRQQLVLAYVVMETIIVYHKLMIQPEGGFYPLIILNPNASKVTIDMESMLNGQNILDKLDDMYTAGLREAQKILADNALQREIKLPMFRRSLDLQVDVFEDFCRIRLPANKPGMHAIQLQKLLTPQQHYFCLELKKFDVESVIAIGIGGSTFALNKYPGKQKDSTGWLSKDGKMYSNEKCNGNLDGERFRAGDTVGVEIEAFAEMCVALFHRNGRPVGTRFITLPRSELFPTITLCGNGHEVNVDVYWQNQLGQAPMFNVMNLDHWCLPPLTEVDTENDIVFVKQHTSPVAIQAPYSLHRGYNHFEVLLVDPFDNDFPPPAIALCTASPFDPPPKSNFKQDFIRFWATGQAQQTVQQGDLMGWGVLYPDSTMHHDAEQLVICYLTINRDVLLTRVMVQPPGGFYPVVLLPPGVDRIKMEFGATIVREHPFTDEAVQKLLQEAHELIAEEEKSLAEGKDFKDEKDFLKPLPSVASEENLKRTATPNVESNQEIKVVKGPSKVQKKPGKIKPAKEEKVRKTKDKKNKQRSPSISSQDMTNQYQSKSCVLL